MAQIDLPAIAKKTMVDYGFWPQFADKVLKEVKKITVKSVESYADDDIVDLRGLLWSSIDNVDSRDLDQLEFCERGSRQEIHEFTGSAESA